MELVTPKIVELDISGELINQPFPLVYPVRSLLNKHVLCCELDNTLRWSLENNDRFFGIQMWLDVVQEIQNMKNPLDERNTLYDYFESIMPPDGESPVDVDPSVVELIKQVFTNREMYFFGIVESTSYVGIYPFGSMDATGLCQIDELGNLIFNVPNKYGVIGIGASVPFHYSESGAIDLLDRRVGLFPRGDAYTDIEVGVSLDFLVKTECSGETMYVHMPVTGFSDNNITQLSQLRELGISDSDIDLELCVGHSEYMIYNSVDGTYSYYPERSDVTCATPQRLLTEEQARKLYPDYFPPVESVGLQAIKRNKIIAF